MVQENKFISKLLATITGAYRQQLVPNAQTRPPQVTKSLPFFIKIGNKSRSWLFHVLENGKSSPASSKPTSGLLIRFSPIPEVLAIYEC